MKKYLIASAIFSLILAGFAVNAAPTPAHAQVYPIGYAPSIQVISPNGGESYAVGSTVNIQWTSNLGYSAQMGSIYLESYPLCGGTSARLINCMALTPAPMLIASNVNLNSGSYTWLVGYPTVTAGQYKIQVCSASTNLCDDSDNYFNIGSQGSSYNGGYGNSAPVVNGIDAPTTVYTGQYATWTVRATDPYGSTLNYSVDWGDVSAIGSQAYPYNQNSLFQQTATFTHIYNQPGTYRVTFTVRNGSGYTTQSSVNVSVIASNTNTCTYNCGYNGCTYNCGAGPLRIVSPNGGENWPLGSTQTIRWTSPYYFMASYSDLRIIPASCSTLYSCSYSQSYPYNSASTQYTIASRVSTNQNYYSWNVGTVESYLPGAFGGSIPAGNYFMAICDTGTNNCDYSDAPFSITQTQSYGYPYGYNYGYNNGYGYGYNNSPWGTYWNGIVNCPVGYICSQLRGY